MLSRVTFVTIGQTPRSDLVPEIASRLGAFIEVAEVGALDGLDGDQIARLAPKPDDHAFVTRLRDGRQAVIGKRWLTNRLQELLDGIASADSITDGRNGSDATVLLTVLLCTGQFRGLRGPGLFLDAQHLVDHGARALCHGARTIGVLVPLARQEGELHFRAEAHQRLETAHASPYANDDFVAAGRTLRGCDLIVMHCMGYSEEQRSAVASGSGRPVLLARRLVASAISQLL